MADSVRRRSKRLRATTQDAPVPRESTSTASLSINGNTSGLPVFPDELLLEVLSYYPGTSKATLKSDAIDVNARLARREALNSLSQTCRNLRKFFRPYIWQCIEVCSGMQVGNSILYNGTKKRDRKFALELLRQLEIVTIRDPALAEYVKIVNVEIQDYSFKAVLTELARCLALFSNLHTVKLQIVETKWEADAIFRRYSYPQIRFVIANLPGCYLLNSCPGVRTVYALDVDTSVPLIYQEERNEFLELVVEHCRYLENFSLGIPCEMIDKLPSLFPNLQELSLIDIADPSWNPNVRCGTSLSMLKDLRIIHIEFESSDEGRYNNERILWAKELFHELQTVVKEKKYVVTQKSSKSKYGINTKITIRAQGHPSGLHRRFLI
ncbi:hypothetical protein BDZ97DRAFT_1754896 [Flammula alnicola]|nr:hypothetical protein BDZ97DRAFT_1754896 [Flammula alnicola]